MFQTGKDQRVIGMVVVAVVGMVAAACGSGESAAPVTTAAPASTTTEAPTTTTTLSEEDLAVRELAGFTSQEAAQFELFNNPPQIPPGLFPLGDLGGPVGDPIPILKLDGAGAPVPGPDGRPAVVAIQFDRLGRYLADGFATIVADDGSAIFHDGAGPVLQAVQFAPEGPIVDEAGNLVTERLVPDQPNRVLVLGDSVILGAADQLRDSFAGWQTIIDAQESRLPGQGDDVFNAHTDTGRVVVVMLGSNVGPGENHRFNIDAVQAAIDANDIVDRVIWVTAGEIGPGQLEFNDAVREMVAERQGAAAAPETYLLDWALYSAANPEYSYDGLHLTPEARTEIAALLAQFVGPPPDCPTVFRDGAAAGQCV